MVRKFRVAVTVTLMTTALCADRVVTAAPALRPQLSQAAREFAGRLSVSLRRVVPAVRLQPERRGGQLAGVAPVVRAAAAPVVHSTDLSPFQFRLPPPVI